MNSIVIFSTRIARDLIKKGYRVIDIKPHDDNKVRTIFFFSKNDGNIEIYLKNQYDLQIK